MKMKNSIAIWADKPGEAHFHINYWIVRHCISDDHFIDFGIKLLNWESGQVSLFFPLMLDNTNILDLSAELKDRDLANALFNENCEIHFLKDYAKRFEIKTLDETLTVLEIDINNDLKINYGYDGSVINFQIPNDPGHDWYIRFRLKTKQSCFLRGKIQIKGSHLPRTIRSIFSEQHIPIGSFYQSVRNSVDAIDFRVNDNKCLSRSLLDDKKHMFLKLKKLHFFLLHNHDEGIDFSSLVPAQVRLLENDTWKKYLHSISRKSRKFCASRWTCNPVKGWEIFIKIRHGSSNLITILSYLCAFFILGVIINYFSAWLPYTRLIDIISSLFI